MGLCSSGWEARAPARRENGADREPPPHHGVDLRSNNSSGELAVFYDCGPVPTTPDPNLPDPTKPKIPPGPLPGGRLPSEKPPLPEPDDEGPTGPRMPFPNDPDIDEPDGPGSEPDYLPGGPSNPNVRR